MHKKSSTGFTLLELLISLSLSSIVMLILVSSFYQLSRNWERQNKLLDDRIDDSLILIEIEKAISAAFPFTFKDENSKKHRIFFQADKNSLQWVSTHSPSYDGAIMIWSIISSDDGFKLQVIPVLSGNPEQQLIADFENKADSEMQLFSDYIISISYLSTNAAADNNDRQWLNEWSTEDEKSLPGAVRLRFDAGAAKPDLKPFNLVSSIAANRTSLIRIPLQ